MLAPEVIVEDRMLKHDLYSQWLGIQMVKVDLGACTIQMKVRDEMVNGFGIGHGGITYGLSDSAFAFASNSRGHHAVSIETSISHTRPIAPGDVLTAVAQEISRGKTIGIYNVTVTNQIDKIVALFKGTVFIKSDIWE